MRRGSVQIKSLARGSGTFRIRQPRMSVCASNRWKRLWNAKWIVRTNRQLMRLYKIARCQLSRGKNRPLWTLRCRSRRRGRWMRTSERQRSSVPETWRPWYSRRSSRPPNREKCSSWRDKIALGNSSKRSWLERPMNRLSTRQMLHEWSEKNLS